MCPHGLPPSGDGIRTLSQVRDRFATTYLIKYFLGKRIYNFHLYNEVGVEDKLTTKSYKLPEQCKSSRSMLNLSDLTVKKRAHPMQNEENKRTRRFIRNRSSVYPSFFSCKTSDSLILTLFVAFFFCIPSLYLSLKLIFIR